MLSKSTLHFWTTERNTIKSIWMPPLERLIEAEYRVNIPSECGTSAELRIENIVHNSGVRAVKNRVQTDERIVRCHYIFVYLVSARTCKDHMR